METKTNKKNGKRKTWCQVLYWHQCFDLPIAKLLMGVFSTETMHQVEVKWFSLIYGTKRVWCIPLRPDLSHRNQWKEAHAVPWIWKWGLEEVSKVNCVSTLPWSLEEPKNTRRLQEFSGESLELFLSQAEMTRTSSGTGICESLSAGMGPKQVGKWSSGRAAPPEK